MVTLLICATAWAFEPPYRETHQGGLCSDSARKGYLIKVGGVLISGPLVVDINLPYPSLPLELPSPALFCREDTVHTLKQLAPGAWDETVYCNPQSGSQWDGFRHVSPMITHSICLATDGLRT